MPVSVVIGGQFGSEGKGKVAHYLAHQMRAAAAVRVGGSNSGHTAVNQDGRSEVFRHLPTAALLSDVVCVLGPGTYINPDILAAEIERVSLPKNRLYIDPHAMIITEEDRRRENNAGLREQIGSTLSGTGAAVERRIMRKTDCVMAGDNPRLRSFVRPTVPFLRELLRRGERVIVEGTQGFGLSLLHSQEYPKATSRDTTAASFAAEAGISPLDVDDVVLVIRAFPIRVPGRSGYLPNEIDWMTITSESDNTQPVEEFTSVTGTLRRVARFDAAVVCRAIEVNNPSRIVLNHLDYVDSAVKNTGELTKKIHQFIGTTSRSIDQKIDLLGFSPSAVMCNPFYSALTPNESLKLAIG